ncbi:MAG TPA: S8 family serine peptidase [Bryobacteraceae bacterium]|nr:S8 family serine peptidase [Bryobacteraceae bacterium]
MRHILKLALACVLLVSSVHAEQRAIVRALGGQVTLDGACRPLGCNVVAGLEDPLSQVFLITFPDSLSMDELFAGLSRVTGIVNFEPDRVAKLSNNRPVIPEALYNSERTIHFGIDVRKGYAVQPAVQIVRLAQAQTTFSVAGGATIAVIDTGVDPDHPVLRRVLLPGYDFTRGGTSSGSEMSDVNQSTAAVVDGVAPRHVNDSTAAVVDQSTAAVVDNRDHAAFGHGTMVAGIIHLAAPRSTILPLKAFRADGSGYTSDILRAVYRAVRHNARVINMSFSMDSASPELERAVKHATSAGSICVASAGNRGQAISVYPAAWSSVIGVASTTNNDRRSTFSNYGSSLVWLAAPGEGVITTYPFGSYAAAWGTSFSTPLVSGTVALLLDIRCDLTLSQVSAALGEALPLGPELGRGRLDVFRALEAARNIR